MAATEEATFDPEKEAQSSAELFATELCSEKLTDRLRQGPGEAAPAETPFADRQENKQKQWRLVETMNALSRRVDSLDGYVIGRAKAIAMYRRVAKVYSTARRIYVGQDNWSVHKHEDVMAALEEWPRIKPVWLPTYAPWLNPIEKLWCCSGRRS